MKSIRKIERTGLLVKVLCVSYVPTRETVEYLLEITLGLRLLVCTCLPAKIYVLERLNCKLQIMIIKVVGQDVLKD